MKFRGPFRRVEDAFIGAGPVEPGLYHYQEGDAYGGVRYHLRVEPDGRGLLSIDASKIIHLNETATEYAKLALEGAGDDAVVARMKSRYKVKATRALEDFADIRDKIKTLGERSDICPISFMDLERIEPFSTPVSAPYRMDLALTYRCENECPHCYVERPRDFEELDTAQWKEVLDRLWGTGVPHVVFTGGEALMRDDLLDLIGYAEDTGLITGLLTNGRRLGRPGVMDSLSASGLDHVQVTIESHDPDVHDRMVGCPGAWEETVAGVKAAVASSVYTITNTTITSLNGPAIEETVDFLRGLGLDTIAMNGVIYTGGAREGAMGVSESDMARIVAAARLEAHEQGMSFIWYTPTRYCDLDPVALGLGPKQCTAARYNMCVEPNGDVIPCQSYYEPLGNILTDDWQAIWESPVARSIRDREFAGEECEGCDTFAVCGGGCPLSAKKDSLLCVESRSSG